MLCNASWRFESTTNGRSTGNAEAPESLRSTKWYPCAQPMTRSTTERETCARLHRLRIALCVSHLVSRAYRTCTGVQTARRSKTRVRGGGEPHLRDSPSLCAPEERGGKRLSRVRARVLLRIRGATQRPLTLPLATTLLHRNARPRQPSVPHGEALIGSRPLAWRQSPHCAGRRTCRPSRSSASPWTWIRTKPSLFALLITYRPRVWFTT